MAATVPTTDMTKAWTRKRLAVKPIGPTPPTNKDGFWRRPQFARPKGPHEREMGRE